MTCLPSPCRMVEDDASGTGVPSSSPAGHKTRRASSSPVEVAMNTTTTSSETDVNPLDLECHSVRDFLNLIAGIRQAKPRDPLRALEDVLLDLGAPEG